MRDRFPWPYLILLAVISLTPRLSVASLFLREEASNQFIKVEAGFEVVLYAFDDPRGLSGRYYTGKVEELQEFGNGDGYLILREHGLAYCNIDPERSKIISREPVEKRSPFNDSIFESLKLAVSGYLSLEGFMLMRHYLGHGVLIEEKDLAKLKQLLNQIKSRPSFDSNDFYWNELFRKFYIKNKEGITCLWDFWKEYREKPETLDDCEDKLS